MTKAAATDDKVIFGFWVYLMSDCVLFAGLFAAYAVLHTATFGGPTGREIFSMQLVFFETIALLTSSFTMGLAMLSVYNRKKHLVILSLLLTLFLGWSFLGMELSEFKQLFSEGHSWRESAFLSSFFTLVGTHGLHVLLGSLWMLVLILSVAWRGLEPSNTRKLMCLSLFWHFLDIVWIFIFTFVYLLPIV